MNKLWYKFTGWLLIIVGIFLSIIAFRYKILGIFSRDVGSFLYELVFVTFVLFIIFVFLFFTGRSFIKRGNDEIEQNKLVSISVVLSLIACFILILGFIVGLLACGIGACDPPDFLVPFYLGLLIGGITYLVSFILLFSNRIKNHGFSLNSSEKKAFLIIFLIFLIISIIIGGFFFHRKSTLSISECDAISDYPNPYRRDFCYSEFRKYNPLSLSFICEKMIPEGSYRDSCYLDKAVYFDNFSICGEIFKDRMKAKCYLKFDK